MPIERVKVKLLTGWAGRPAGWVFPLMDKRTADIMVANGQAELVSDDESSDKPKRKRKRTVKRTVDTGGSETTPPDQPERLDA